MKILAVLAQNPFSYSDGGTYAVRSSLRHLSGKGDLCVTGFGHDFSSPSVGSYRSAGTLGEVSSPLPALFDAIAHNRSYSVAKYASPGACEAFQRIVAADDYAVIWYDKLLTAAVALRSGILASNHAHPVHVLRSHNIEHVLLGDRFDAGSSLKRFLLSREMKLLGVFEQEIFSRVGLALTISSEDRDRIIDLLPGIAGRVDVLPVSPEQEAYQARTARDRNTILFVGDCRWRPNLRAARWIAEELSPELQRANPTLVVRMIGRGTEAFQGRVANIQGCGFVDDLSAEYEEALCTLAPIWHGGGVNIKVVESLARGVPVVGSGFARRGITAEGYLTAETVSEYLACIQQLKAAPQEAHALGMAAQLSMSKVHRRFDELWEQYIELPTI